MNSKISFLPLSGMDEKYNNSYCLEINDDIFIFNAGIDALIDNKLGISKIVPDYSYLVKNKDKIKGIFIGTPTYENFGSLPMLLDKIGFDTPIFTSEIGKKIIENLFEKQFKITNKTLNFQVLNYLKDFQVNGLTFTAFKIANSIPYSCGFVIKTPQGAIVFLDDYLVLNEQSLPFHSQLLNLKDILKGQQVLLLVTKTGLVNEVNNFTAPSHSIKSFYEKIMTNTDERIIIGCNANDIYNIVSISQLCKKFQKPLIIYSRNFIDIFKSLIRTNIINQKGLLLLPPTEINKSKNAVVLIIGSNDYLMNKLSRLHKDEDKNLKLREKDNFIVNIFRKPGYELPISAILDNISRLNVNTFTLAKTIKPLQAGNEDHKLLSSLLKPKYIIPIGGLYKSQIQYSDLIQETWVTKDKILILENGEFARFENSELLKIKNDSIKLTQQYTGANQNDIEPSTLYERQQMSENGVICVNLTLKKVEKNVEILNLSISDYGIINYNDSMSKTLLDEIKADARENILGSVSFLKNNQIDFSETKIGIKKLIIKKFERKLKKRPIISTIVTVI